MKIYIKNMVCNRCNSVVRSELENIGLHALCIQLGEVELSQDFKGDEKEILSKRLYTLGFELLENKNAITIERIKNRIVDLVHHKGEELKTNLSNYLEEELGQDYNILSTMFSEVEGKTIAHFFITQKIEKVKELLLYDELTLSEIAIQLHYSDVAHLSNQFKKRTGFTPTHFKKIKENQRLQIDKL